MALFRSLTHLRLLACVFSSVALVCSRSLPGGGLLQFNAFGWHLLSNEEAALGMGGLGVVYIRVLFQKCPTTHRVSSFKQCCGGRHDCGRLGYFLKVLRSLPASSAGT